MEQKDNSNQKEYNQKKEELKDNTTSNESTTKETESSESLSKKWLKNKKNDKIKELEKKIEELKNDLLRTRADFDNFRKRKEKETNEARERAVTNFVLDILPSIDNFEMSLKMTDNKEMFIKGVEMIHKNLIDTLKENHFIEFEPKIGEEFNPYMHDPILIEDHSKKPGQIVGILKKGFMFKNSVVRHAKVQVAKEHKEEQESKKENQN